MKKRLITAAIIAIVAVPLLVLGGWYTIALVEVACGISIYEILKLGKGKNWSIAVYIVTILYAIILMNWGFLITYLTNGKVLNLDTLLQGFETRVNILVIVSFLISLLIVEAASHNLDLNTAFFLFALTLIITIACQGIVYIRNSIGVYGLLYVILTTFMCDAIAHVVGVKFGKRKLAPLISPKKTIEGAIGGVIGCSIIGTVCFILFPFNIGYILNTSPLSWLFMFAVSFILGVGAVVGDLVFSSIKRQANIKDFSELLPGHGGLLDRCDSLFFNILIFLVIYVTFRYGIGLIWSI